MEHPALWIMWSAVPQGIVGGLPSGGAMIPETTLHAHVDAAYRRALALLHAPRLAHCRACGSLVPGWLGAGERP